METVELEHASETTGTVRDGIAYVRRDPGREGFVLYGSYRSLSAGRYSVEFAIDAEVGDIDVLGDPVVALLQVVCNNGQTMVCERRVLLSHLTADAGSSAHTLSFALHEPRAIEYRIWTTGQVPIVARTTVTVNSIRTSASAPLPIDKELEWKNEQEYLDGYLRNVNGVIHVGANTGQERRYYWLLGKYVAWVEAIKEVYDELVDNVAQYDRQRPINALLADRDGRTFEFKIANNKGASSSILDLQDHAEIFPDIEYVETRTMTGTTLSTMMAREGLSCTTYQALTLDAEGAELMILKGARNILSGFKYIKCEVADFPARTGTPTVAELDAVLREAGFAQLIRRMFARGPGLRGTYWDIVWKRIEPGVPLNQPGLPLPIVAHAQDVEGLEKLPG